MKANREIYYNCKSLNKPVIIIEVGNLKRGETWRISLNHINNLGIFGNDINLNECRPSILGVELKPIPVRRRGEILIACQHQDSLQWEGMPLMKTWCEEIISKIKQHTHRRIIVRPHPRSSFPFKMSNILFERPQRVPNTYDDFNILYGYHCVINYNSGPAVQAAIQGIPILCDSSSLASPVSASWETLDNPQLPDREEWFLKLCHTEWTVKEIAQGIPLQRLLLEIAKQIS
jgi:hypothetical protein